MGQIKLPEGAAPSTPASTYGALYNDTNGRLHFLDDAGLNTPLMGVGARVYNSANISINDSTTTALTFDTERFDTDAIHSTSSNMGRLTCTQAGKYMITAHVRYATNSTGTRQTAIRLNGTTNIAVDTRAGNTSSNICQVNITTIYNLAVGDYVEATAFQNSGGALNVEASSANSPEFGMWYLGT